MRDGIEYPDFRDPNGRFDQASEMAWLLGTAVIEAAREHGHDPEPLVRSVFNNYGVLAALARQRPTGPDGLPLRPEAAPNQATT